MSTYPLSESDRERRLGALWDFPQLHFLVVRRCNQALFGAEHKRRAGVVIYFSNYFQCLGIKQDQSGVIFGPFVIRCDGTQQPSVGAKRYGMYPPMMFDG